MDVDAYFGESDLLEWVELKQASTPDCMIVAVCKVKSSVDMSVVEKEIEKIWLNSLRYSFFEDHQVEQIDGGFVFHFVTTSSGLGVVGTIECRR